MASLDENLESTKQVKRDFKSMLTNKNVSYSNVRFDDFPDLIASQMQKKASGTLNVSENGRYDVTTYSGINVDVAGSANDLDYIKYHDDMLQIEDGTVPPTDQEYEIIIEKGYKILDYVFRGIKS